jgi:hypothetical protein
VAHDDADDKGRAHDDRPALHTLTMRRVIATFTGLLSVFFVFWFVRLLVVTGFLQHVRPGGGGAYMGAVVFPLLAIAFGWVTIRLWRRAE